MSSPTVNVASASVTVVPATNSPPGAAPAISYNVGVRPSTGTAGTYPFMTTIPATANPLAVTLAALGVTTAGNYEAAAQAVTALGATAWGAEFSFTASVQPNPPTVVVA